MGFGASLAFIAIGAVLAFAVKWDIPGIDLQMIGWILIAVGAVGAALTGMYTRRPHAEDTVETIEPDVMFTVDPPGEPRIVHEHVVHETRDPRVVREVHEETAVHPRVNEPDPHVTVRPARHVHDETTPIRREEPI
jgi:hypothetical protein